jgi:hypothetical protein
MCQSSPSVPSSTTSVAELPDWAKGYAKDTLAKGAALTDINQNPYQKYGGERVAGFQPLQQQAFNTVGGLDAGPQGFQQQIGSYMSPYMQNVVDIEKREAARQSGIAGTQQQAQATQAGAFGGGRDAIMRAERERNLAQQMGDIQTKGSQAAYEQAANQFRQGITQQSGLAGQQAALGQVQQQQAQRPMDIAYQDFLNQQNYPYKQIGFMSDLIRGLPLGQKSTAQTYDPGPGLAQTIGSLGLGAAGLSKAGLFADGGLAYAGGGVTSPQNIEGILSKLSDQQLARARQTALDRRDLQEVQMIDAEMAERASIRGGLGSAFNQIPQNQQEQMMAGGGMVAFAKGGDTYGKKFEDSLVSLQDMANQVPPEQTPEQRDEAISARIPMLEKRYGPDITQPYLEELKTRRAALPEQMNKDTGLAMAMAGFKMLGAKGTSQKGKLIQGISDAGESFVSSVNQLQKENREADDKLRQSELLIATAQQSRKEGLVNKADAEETRAQDLKRDVYKTQVGIREKVAQLQSGMAGHEMQKEATLGAANISAAAHRYAADKPGEMERIMSTVNDIRSGKKVYAGKTGEEGAKAYQDDLSQTGAARYGVKYTGPDPTFANSAKFQAELDKRTSMLQLRKSAPGVTPAEIQDLDRQIETERQKLINEYRDTMASGVTSKNQPAPTAAPVVSDAEKQAAAAKNRDKLGTIVPRIGTIEDGHRFKGGDPANPANWEKV